MGNQSNKDTATEATQAEPWHAPSPPEIYVPVSVQKELRSCLTRKGAINYRRNALRGRRHTIHSRLQDARQMRIDLDAAQRNVMKKMQTAQDSREEFQQNHNKYVAQLRQQYHYQLQCVAQHDALAQEYASLPQESDESQHEAREYMKHYQEFKQSNEMLSKMHETVVANSHILHEQLASVRSDENKLWLATNRVNMQNQQYIDEIREIKEKKLQYAEHFELLTTMVEEPLFQVEHIFPQPILVTNSLPAPDTQLQIVDVRSLSGHSSSASAQIHGV